MKNFFIQLIIIIVMLAGCTSSQPSGKNPDIIPLPVWAELKNGSFTVDKRTEILVSNSDDEVKMVADGLREKLSALTGSTISVKQAGAKQPKNSILLKVDEALSDSLGNEGYHLRVTSSGIEIAAPHPAGLFYGVQTIYQLLPVEIFGDPSKILEKKTELTIPCLEMTDFPAFSWRGMHLDVSRHFFPKEFVKKYIDLIALHKMNVFHWHLTDDNGWRIEIDQYPKLTEVSAWRADREDIPWNDRSPQRPGEPATYGGYYTKEDIREIVEYARQRFITVIPEIEMPGHSCEVFAAYPELSCSGERVTVRTGSYWPVTDIFCAGKEETFRFITNVLDEVVAMFPSEYIHIGGDEADKTAWRKCPDCQARIRKEGLAGVDELQSYFVKRIEKHLVSKGRKLIGWDEILEGGLAPEATVMSWRGFEGGIEAAVQGHKVVMCPTSHCYFDYYQADPNYQPAAIGGLTTVKKVYSFRPVPSELQGEQRDMILGGQGNLWTEYISSPSHAEYMALPRMTALAEVLWSPEDKLAWDDFRSRLQTQFDRFENMNVNYSPGSGKVDIKPVFNLEDKPYALQMETEIPGTTIYFTLDGTNPGKNSFLFKNPVGIDHDVKLKAIAYKDENQLERFAEYEINFHAGIGKNISYNESYSERYPAAGQFALNDGLRGTLDHKDGMWQGFNGINMDVVIDMGEDVSFKTIISTFLLDQQKWIFIPEKVNYYISMDGQNFQKLGEILPKIPLNDPNALTNDFKIKLDKPIKIRYIRVEAVNIGVCPDWHPAKGQKAWIFIDEIVIK